MKLFARKLLAAAAILAVTLSAGQSLMALTVDELVGTWNMTYNNGQGDQTGTITVTRNDDGSAKIVMATSGGGNSEATDIAITGDDLTFSRAINLQGQSLDIDYTAKLVDGSLTGSYTIDTSAFGGAAAGAAAGLGGPTPWTATKAN